MRFIFAILLACAAASPASAQPFAERFEAAFAEKALAVRHLTTWHQRGIASIYDQGRKTACGGGFDPRALTAAHRTLPCGTIVRVSRGDRSVVVMITDRGPFVPGRVIDLTPAAAKALGFDGLADVRLERL
jgi:rare lipoprotein A